MCMLCSPRNVLSHNTQEIAGPSEMCSHLWISSAECDLGGGDTRWAITVFGPLCLHNSAHASLKSWLCPGPWVLTQFLVIMVGINCVTTASQRVVPARLHLLPT